MKYEEFVERGGFTIDEKIQMYEKIKELLETERTYPYICNRIIKYIAGGEDHSIILFHNVIDSNFLENLFTEYFPEFAKHKPQHIISWDNPWFLKSVEDPYPPRIKLLEEIIEELISIKLKSESDGKEEKEEK